MTTEELKKSVADLNSMILNGQMIDAFDKYYGEEVIMRENQSEPTIGKEANRKRELEFANNIEEFRGAEVKSVAVWR